MDPYRTPIGVIEAGRPVLEGDFVFPGDGTSAGSGFRGRAPAGSPPRRPPTPPPPPKRKKKPGNAKGAAVTQTAVADLNIPPVLVPIKKVLNNVIQAGGDFFDEEFKAAEARSHDALRYCAG